MNLVAPGPALLAGLFVFFVPGLLFLALLAPRDRESAPLDEALYLVVSVSVTLSAWLGLVLAEAGCFSLVTAGLVLAGASLIAAVAGRRRLRWPRSRSSRGSAMVPAAIVLALAFALQARPTEYLLGGRDPGTYIAAMGVIARTGGIVYTDPLVLSIPRGDLELFYRNPDSPDFTWGRFMGFPLERPESGRVFPEFFHLFPAFGAYLFQAMGVKGALATPPVFGILGTLGAFFAFRRILGPAAALLGALLLASNVVQVWFARYPVSEPVSQFLIFLALVAFFHWEERGSIAFALLAGTALGVSLLVRIDSVLIVLPLGLYLLIRRAHGDLPWRTTLPLVLPFLLLSLHAAVHAAFWSRKYVVSITTRPYWHQPPLVWAAVAAGLLGALAAAHHWGPRLIARLETRRETLQQGLIGALVGLALYAYFLRPWLSAWAGGDGNPRALALADPGLLHRLGFQRLAAHDAQAFYRLGWFVSPLGLVLGVLGLLVLMIEWRPRYLFLVLTTLTFSLFYFYKIRVWNDYFFALRRFVPVVLPCLLGFAAFALVRLARGGGPRRPIAALLGLTLFGLFLEDTLPLAGYVDWRNSVKFVADVARRFGPEDVVIFEQRASIHLLSLPLWSVHGVNVLELARFNPDPDRLNHLIQAWRGRYRNIYFVKTYRTDLCGIFLQRVEDHAFGTYEWERTLEGPPRQPVPRALHFTVSRVTTPEELQVPALSEVDIGGTDDFQVSGFFDKEGGGDQTYRWTGACASVYMPGVQASKSLVITAATGKRPRPALVEVSLSGEPLGRFTPGPKWADYTVPLPATLPAGPPLLRLDILDPMTRRPAAWRPQNVFADSKDTRDLGIMVDRIRIAGAPGSRDTMTISATKGGQR